MTTPTINTNDALLWINAFSLGLAIGLGKVAGLF